MLMPVPEAEVEADRLVKLCMAHIEDRIPGLSAPRIPIAGGQRDPGEYSDELPAAPHDHLEKRNELWVRHDRQKSKCRSPR